MASVSCTSFQFAVKVDGGNISVVDYRTHGFSWKLQKRPASAPRVGLFSVPLLQAVRGVCLFTSLHAKKKRLQEPVI